MKKWIKQAIYRLMGDSRRDIISELQREQEQLSEAILSIQKQLSQFQEEACCMLTAIDGRQEFIRQEYARLEQQMHIHLDLSARDIQIVLSKLAVSGNPLYQEKRYELHTDYPVACESMDHLHPWGTKNDNTRAPFFIRKCETLFPDKPVLRFADLGCAGGGIVLDALLRGHQAIGLEGSDYSLKHQRAEWRLLENNLFTCDIAKPYSVLYADGSPAYFDIVSAWEVFEHIPQEDVPQLAENIANMMAPGGYFIGTVSQVEDYEPESGELLHVTIRPVEWWYARLETAGLRRAEGVFEPCDLARAYGNAPLPWLLAWPPENNPYVVVRKPF